MCVPYLPSFLHAAFVGYGLSLEIYVDQAGIFTGSKEDSLARIEQRLKFYDVSFVVANTPEAKGKVERIHQVWQERLPPYFALNSLTSSSDLETVNHHIQALRQRRNRREWHRELSMTPLLKTQRQAACSALLSIRQGSRMVTNLWRGYHFGAS